MQAEKIKKDPYQEALRYIENAKQILREKAGKDGELKVIISQEGIKLALRIIEWCK
ncbi:MAG: hypothetical protein HPY79_11640 [Bacteroidales bacterium]|nr:hypothetical protein [Bacteroidales bacterium]